MRIVDVWGQMPTTRMAEAPWLASLSRWTGQSPKDYTPGPERTLAAMDDAGVEIMLASAWYGPGGPLVSNEEVAAQIAAAPDRLKGLASADLTRPMEAVRDIRKWVGEEGFVGVRVVPWLWNLPPNDRRYYPIYAACVELDVPFCTQIGHTGPLLSSEVGRPIPYLEDVLLEFPELKVVGGHLGFPWIPEIISLAHKFPNFYVDTSAYAAHRFPADFIEFMTGPGSGRVMFGTNWPMLSPAQCLEGVERLGLTEKQHQAFLGNTARKVFRLQS
jgi:uncharacterized protein